MTRICLCADDYGLSPGVSCAIRELAEAGRISASGAMTVWPDWPRAGAALRDAPALDWGLHLTLTDAPAPTSMPRLAPSGRLPTLGRLLARAQAVGLPREEVREAVTRQVDAFEAIAGFPPRFIDGHRHVHVLPGVREEVVALLGERLDPARTWLRVCTGSLPGTLSRGVARQRALLVDALSRPLARLTRRAGLRTNADFRGITAFGANVAWEFEAWLDGALEGTLVMCHPGRVDDVLTARDPVHGRREAELGYLASPRFAEALARRGLTLAPLSAIRSTSPASDE